MLGMSAFLGRILRQKKAAMIMGRKRGLSSLQRLTLEPVESRLYLSLSILGTVNLPATNGASWDYSQGTYNASPVMADLANDGHDEVLVVGGDGNLYGYTYNTTTHQIVFYGQNSANPTAVPPIQVAPIVADVPGTGRVIFAGASDGNVYAWNAATGSLLTGWPQTVAVPATLNPTPGVSNAILGAISVADLDGDGVPEILATSLNHELTVWHADGSVAWRFDNDAAIFGGVVVGDINNDGRSEVILAGNSDASSAYSAGGRLTVITAEGKRQWVYATSAAITTAPVLADLQGNGTLNVVFGTASGGNGNKVYALDSSGAVLSGWPYVTATANVSAGIYDAPAIADLNGDGALEVIFADANGNLNAVKKNGQLLWSTIAHAPAPIYATPIVADTDGDNLPDVILGTGNTLTTYAGGTGTQIDQDILPDINGSPAVITTAGAIGHFKGDSSWQLAVTADASSNGTALPPALLRVYDLATTTLAPAWAQQRGDETGVALTRSSTGVEALGATIYQFTLNRLPSIEEAAAWLDHYTHSPNLLPIIENLLGSVDARALQINSWYLKYLHRNGESTGLQGWQNYLAAGNSYLSAQTNFAASPEAFALAGGTNAQWINYLYITILGRTPSAQENASWTTQLNAGTKTRSGVVRGFLFSLENTKNLILDWYTRFAPGGQNSPTKDSLQAAAWDLRRGQPEEVVRAKILTSGGNYAGTHPEANLIKNLYQDVLGRAPGAAETVQWLSYLENGGTQTGLVLTIRNSYEALDRIVESYYEKYLGRTASATERTNWVLALARGASEQNIIATFLTTAEYLRHVGGTVSGFLHQAWRDILNREIDDGTLATWTTLAAKVDIRATIAHTLVTSNEYAVRQTKLRFVQYLRRFPTMTADQSANIPGVLTSGGQFAIDYLNGGGTLQHVDVVLLATPEYASICQTKALWTLGRWKTMA